MMKKSRLPVMLGGSVALLMLFLPATVALQQPADSVTLEITSKRYSAGYLPVAGSYVEYEVRLTNSGARAIESQSLHVSLVSDGNGTHSAATYSVPSLGPSESKTLHLGPFKMEEEGMHRLLAEMDGASLNYKPDSFIAYRQETVQTVLIAIPLIAAGAGIIGFSMYRRRRAV